MITISRAVPQQLVIPSYRRFFIILGVYWRTLERRLRAGQEREFLRTLDQRVREDLGLPSDDRKTLQTGDEPTALPKPLQEVFSWTRFSK